uniref:PHM7_cyt domain-containing protein n=1 Tax=Bursaphelenchus xylophilus TaxID=6326 RepID=A0A1I7SN19_BURXY
MVLIPLPPNASEAVKASYERLQKFRIHIQKKTFTRRKFVRNSGTVIAFTTITAFDEFKKVVENMEEQVESRNELFKNSCAEARDFAACGCSRLSGSYADKGNFARDLDLFNVENQRKVAYVEKTLAKALPTASGRGRKTLRVRLSLVETCVVRNAKPTLF